MILFASSAASFDFSATSGLFVLFRLFLLASVSQLGLLSVVSGFSLKITSTLSSSEAGESAGTLVEPPLRFKSKSFLIMSLPMLETESRRVLISELTELPRDLESPLLSEVPRVDLNPIGL